MVDAFIRANQSLWRVQKEMNSNMDAALLLGTSERDLREGLARMSKKDYGYVKSGNFKAYYPSDDVLDGIVMNARKLGLPNPYNAARDAMNKIYRQIIRLKTNKGAEFPKLINPFRSMTDTIDKQQGSLIQNNVPIETSEVSEEVVQTSALPSNVNQNSGLTSIEEALLSNEEKAMRLRQRGLTA